jgi:hypothetical protein
MYICQGYRDTLDYFAHVILWAPNFDDEEQVTLEGAFQSLKHGMDAIESGTTDLTSLEMLENCRAELDKSKSFYLAGNRSDGVRHLQRAREWFRQVTGTTKRNR